MSVFLAFGPRRARFWVMLTETPLAACVLLTSAMSLTRNRECWRFWPAG
jgi:hypothetical protein